MHRLNSCQSAYLHLIRHRMKLISKPTAGQSHFCKMSSDADETKMSAADETITLREATLADKNEVMAIDVYGGRDYLPALYKDFIQDPDTYPLVVVADNKVVGFSMTTTFDGGVTVMKRAGRVAENYRGCGFFKMMGADLNRHTQQQRPKVLYETVSNTNKEENLYEHFISEGYKLIYIKGATFRSLAASNQCPPEDAPRAFMKPGVKKMSRQDLGVLFQAETSKARLFPEGRLFNFHMSYRLFKENIPALIGRTGGAFYTMCDDAVLFKDTDKSHDTSDTQPTNTDISRNQIGQFLENTSCTASENSIVNLKLSDAKRIALVTFYFSVPTPTGYHYFVDVYTPVLMPESESRDHLIRHLQRHLFTARRQFQNKRGVLGVAFEPHLSKDMVTSCLSDVGLLDDHPGPKTLYLYEKSLIRNDSSKASCQSRL